MPVDPTKPRGIGLSNIYTDVEIDQMIANAQAGIPVAGFSDLNPLTYQTPATTQSNGQHIGLSPDGMEIHQPDIVGGLPVVVNGRRYLIALIPG
jgi:hypothetical protein